jgi:hypothetical protein
MLLATVPRVRSLYGLKFSTLVPFVTYICTRTNSTLHRKAYNTNNNNNNNNMQFLSQKFAISLRSIQFLAISCAVTTLQTSPSLRRRNARSVNRRRVEAMNNLWYAPESLAGQLSVGFLFHRCSLALLCAAPYAVPIRVAVMGVNDFD